MLPRLALRAACAWLVLTLLVSLWGPQTIVAARPLVQAMVEWMLPGFITRVMLKPPPDDGTNRAAAGGDVAMELKAMAPVQIAGPLGVHPWFKLTQSINAGHDLVSAIVFFSVLAAWPFASWRQRATALALGVPLCAALVVWLVAVHFTGLFEISLQEMAAQHGLQREPRFVLTQLLFNESGGQWLVALVGAMAVASFAGRHRNVADPKMFQR